MEKADLAFDHIGLWCTELAASSARFETLTGVRPAEGGRPEGQGTWNRLAGAEGGTYVELIAKDPTQEGLGQIARMAANLPDLSPCLVAYRSKELEAVAERARSAGCKTPGPFAMSRRGKDGELLNWRILFVTNSAFPNLPFFIDWMDTPHPSSVLSPALALSGLTFVTPDPKRLDQLFGLLGVSAATRYGETAGLDIRIKGPDGVIDASGRLEPPS